MADQPSGGGREQETGKEVRQFAVAIQWQDVGDVLVRADDDHAAPVTVDPAHVEDVSESTP